MNVFDTVNMASRIETSGLPDVIVVTKAVVDRVGAKYQFEPRGPIFIKGKGTTLTYALVTETATFDRRSTRPGDNDTHCQSPKPGNS